MVSSLVNLPGSSASSGAQGTNAPAIANVSDEDAGALAGIAITAADAGAGTWWYSVDNGSNWSALGAVSNLSARLLAADSATRLYFQPSADWNGTLPAALGFRAWDQSSGGNGLMADTSGAGGASAFSLATANASVTVTPVNDAPQGRSAQSAMAAEASYVFSMADFSLADPQDLSLIHI